MAVTKISNSGIKTGVLKYDSMLAGNAAYDPAATWLIQRINGTGSSSTITFSSIPSTYTSLQIRGIVRTDSGTGIGASVRLNGDTGANYASHQLYGDGTTAAVGGAASATSITNGGGLGFGSTTAANIVGAFILDIHDYASTTRNKTTRVFTGRDDNSTGFIRVGSGLWMNTAAVTSISLVTSNGSNFTTQTTFALYGMKG